jgi:translocation and assembly module TamA
VFERIRNVDFGLQHSLGFGLRYGSAIGLIRVDVAVPLNRRDRDRGFQVWFGLGQAF